MKWLSDRNEKATYAIQNVQSGPNILTVLQSFFLEKYIEPPVLEERKMFKYKFIIIIFPYVLVISN